MTVLNLQVGASTDDAGERVSSGAMELTFAVVRIGSWQISSHSGFRFTGVSGLSGATINAGTVLNFPNALFSDSGAFVADWYAHDAAAPGTFTSTTSNISDTAQRPRTTATCEGDGTDFGNWTAGDNGGAGWDFTGDGVNTIADIIQELADSYDPSAIVLLHIFTSGIGERMPRSYDDNSIYGAKLDIDYTAATGDQTLTAPATFAEVGMTAAALAPGTATLTAPEGRVNAQAPTATLAGTDVATLTAPATSADAVTPTHALAVQGAATLTAPSTAANAVVPDAIVSSTATQSLLAAPAVAHAVAPTHTLAGQGTVTVAAPATIVGVGMVAASQVPDTATLAGPATSADAVASAGVLIPRPASLTAVPAVVHAVVPEAILTGGGAALGFEPWGDITQWIDPDQCAPGTSFILQAAIFTSSALNTVTARVFDVAAGTEVAGSRVTSTSTALGSVQSSAFTSGLTSGLREYRLDFGGESGAIVYCQGGEVRGISS